MTPYTKDWSTDPSQTRMEYGLAKEEIQAAKLLVPTLCSAKLLAKSEN